MRLFRDIETGEMLRTEDLLCEYREKKKNGGTESIDFYNYLQNCLAINNGTLEEVKE